VGGVEAGVLWRIRRTVSPSGACAGGWPSAHQLRRPLRSRGPEDTDCLSQPPGALCVVGSEGRQAFRKGLARTCGGGTTETPDVQAEAHRVLHDREVTQVARIATMHVCRRGVTIRTGGLGCIGTGIDQEQGISGGDVFYHKAREAKGK
jgi:hypothetical protein